MYRASRNIEARLLRYLQLRQQWNSTKSAPGTVPQTVQSVENNSEASNLLSSLLFICWCNVLVSADDISLKANKLKLLLLQCGSWMWTHITHTRHCQTLLRSKGPAYKHPDKCLSGLGFPECWRQRLWSLHKPPFQPFCHRLSISCVWLIDNRHGNQYYK